MNPSARRHPLTYAVIVVLAVAATVFGVSNGRILGVSPIVKPNPQVPAAGLDPVDTDPAPGLFKDADLLPVSAALDPEYERAESDIDDFYGDQPAGRTVDDAAFVAWASEQITAQPSVATRSTERAALDSLARSTKREASARWLGLHGCRDVWASMVLEQKRFHIEGNLVAKKSELAEVLDLAARVASAAARRFGGDDTHAAAAPCAPRTPLAADEGCGCSFPSAAAVMAGTARTYLVAFAPDAQYRYAWMEKQVDLAAVYQGLELPGDVAAGGYLGYLTGRYFLASRGYPAPSIPVPAPPGLP